MVLAYLATWQVKDYGRIEWENLQPIAEILGLCISRTSQNLEMRTSVFEVRQVCKVDRLFLGEVKVMVEKALGLCRVAFGGSL